MEKKSNLLVQELNTMILGNEAKILLSITY